MIFRRAGWATALSTMSVDVNVQSDHISIYLCAKVGKVVTLLISLITSGGFVHFLVPREAASSSFYPHAFFSPQTGWRLTARAARLRYSGELCLLKRSYTLNDLQPA